MLERSDENAAGQHLPKVMSITASKLGAKRLNEPLLPENTWRAPVWDDGTATSDVLMSRWVHSSGSPRQAFASSPSDRHIVSICMRAANLRWSSGERIIFSGTMSPGTIHISAPAQTLAAEFLSPCDFIHLHVRNELLPAPMGLNDRHNPGGMLPRDALVDQLCRSLLRDAHRHDGSYARSVARTIAMRVAVLGDGSPCVEPLQPWRLRKVRAYIDEHLGEKVTLQDLSNMAGLSRMYFAAQFHAATGFRPHEYLLAQRMERAQAELLHSKSSIIEIALAVGFQSQAHFTTVFSRLTGETPARWRRRHQGQVLTSGQYGTAPIPP